MDEITMTFPHINDSVQIGDTVYYQTAAGVITEMGACTAVTATTVSCNIGGTVTRPTGNDFILFSKDNAASMSSILGYYAEVKMTNTSTTEAELFQVGLDMFGSSGHK